MIGAQEPRVCWVPDGLDHPDADAAVELATEVGLKPDPWQEARLRQALRRREPRWAAFEVGLVCPRQNGKNALLEMRELAGLFLLRERLIIHSAHHGKTARLAFRRLEQMISGTPWLAREVAHVWRTNGFEAIELKSGQRIEFQTRTKSAGRGYSGDLIVIDEAMDFSEAAQSALAPILTTATDPQIWYTGSAVDQMIHFDGLVFAALRARGIEGADENLAFFEWALDFEDPSSVPEDVFEDEAMAAAANPGYGIRFGPDWIERERGLFSGNMRGLAVERYGVGDWPDLDGVADGLIPWERWLGLVDEMAVLEDPICLGVDVSPDRRTSIVAVGLTPRGESMLEVVESKAGTAWAPTRLAELVERHDVVEVVCDAYGPAASIASEIEDAGVTLRRVSVAEHGQACGMLVDRVAEGGLRHLGQPELDAAVRGARTRPLGDAWAWSRKTSTVDISPLVAGTLGLFSAVDRDLAGSELAIY